ncbi:MAG: hypothetical protein LBV16_09045 [Elusimicrobiota bacterium]|jgi:hypothetical protein|nr:hypothetical protein [Elusimicrobiota bacterium]
MTKKQEWITMFIVCDIINFYMQDTGMPLIAAMNKFYTSQVFDKLQDIESGLYSEGSGFVYDLFKTELEYGKLKQLEI